MFTPRLFIISLAGSLVLTACYSLLLLALSKAAISLDHGLILLLAGFIFCLACGVLLNFRLEKINQTLNIQTGSSVQENVNGPFELIEHKVKALEKARKLEIERMAKLELYRKEYLGDISHELKTPVFNIQGYILTLLEGGIDDPSVNRDYLKRAEKSIDRMITMIEDLESISQIETGELVLDKEPFDLGDVLKDILQSLEMRSTQNGIIISTEKNYEKTFVYADKIKIRQVLTNLLVNSIKYGREFGETIVRISDHNGKYLIEVIDNGIGIAEENLPRLFERFYRVDRSRSRDQGGTGLGLSIVKHIIEAHDEKISVESKLNEGTKFSFTLQKAVAEQNAS